MHLHVCLLAAFNRHLVHVIRWLGQILKLDHTYVEVDPDMHIHYPACLVILLLVTVSLGLLVQNGHGQSTTIDQAQRELILAFVAVQQADLNGVSPQEVALLASNLNLALDYEINATRFSGTNVTASNDYAVKSEDQSAATSDQARSWSNAAQSQSLFNQFVLYSIAVASAFGSSLVVSELHRVTPIVRTMKQRLRRVRVI